MECFISLVLGSNSLDSDSTLAWSGLLQACETIRMLLGLFVGLQREIALKCHIAGLAAEVTRRLIVRSDL